MATKFLDYTGLSHLWSKIKEWCSSIFVTKATDENITGTKTFVGSKKIAFKQSGANDKLGFTLYNNSSKEQGYLEYNPTNKIANVPLFTLGNYATATNELTYVGFRRYSNISGASGAYNLLAPLISDAKTPFNLTTTYTNFYLPLGISDGTNIVTASNSGVVDISSLLPTVPTIPNLSRTISGSGNAITDITVSGHAITATKGTTFLTSHQTLPTLSLTTSGSGNAITALSVSDHAITATKGSTFLTSHQDISGKVNKSGDTITGNITLKKDNITRGSSTTAVTCDFFDVKDSANNRVSCFSTLYFANKGSETNIYAYNTTASSGGNIGYIGIGCNSSGTIYTHAPTPATSSNDTNIATTAFVKAQGYTTATGHTHSYLPLSGGTLTGTLNGTTIIFDGTLAKKHPSITKGTAPSSGTYYWTLNFADKNGFDYANNTLAQLESRISTDNKVYFYMRAMKNTAATSTNAEMGVVYDTNNSTGWAYCPTPAADANDTRIATTKWVKDRAYITSSSNITGTAANVTGTVAIDHGGTGATTRLNAVKALTNENVGTGAQYFLTITNSWGKAGYTSVADAKTVLGLKSAAYTESSAYATAGHTHSNYLTSHQSLANYVTLNGTQTITGAKTFSTSIVFNEGGTWSNGPSSNVYRSIAYKQNDNTNDGDILFYFNSVANGASKGFILRPDLQSLLTVFWKDTSDFGINAQCDVYSSTGHDLGRSNRKWGKVYATTGTIQTSDERLKEDITNIPDSVLDVWENISWKQFKLKESIKEKGKDSARIHSGIIAQDVKELFNNANVNCEKYGFFCYDEWDAIDEQRDNEGRLLVAKLEAGNQYSIRYEEALCIEAAYQRRKNKILEKRISELETQVQNMLQILESLKGA